MVNGKVTRQASSFAKHCGGLGNTICHIPQALGTLFKKQYSAKQSKLLSGRPTILSKLDEKELACHIRNLAAAGFPLDRSDV